MPMGKNGEPIIVAQPEETQYRCPKCGSATVQKTGPYGPYIDCLQREAKTCDFRAGVPAGVPCPEEPETGQLVEKRTRRGIFYGCWNYPNCSYTTNTLEPGKMTKPRGADERAAANMKLLERSARGKARSQRGGPGHPPPGRRAEPSGDAAARTMRAGDDDTASR